MQFFILAYNATSFFGFKNKLKIYKLLTEEQLNKKCFSSKFITLGEQLWILPCH